jgi:hypothetical protein
MKSIQSRVADILVRPAEEWRRIAAESDTVEGLVRGYAAPLAAIPAVCRLISFSFVGVPTLGAGAARFGIVRGVAAAAVSWVMALLGVWISAMVLERLAPTFDSKGGRAQALKVVVYSMTPVWIAGVLFLVPALSELNLLAGLYAIYLCYVGLPIVMGTPSDKVIPYMLVAVLVIIVVSAVLSSLAAAIAGVGVPRLTPL